MAPRGQGKQKKLTEDEMAVSSRVNLTQGLITTMALTSLLRLAAFITMIVHLSYDNNSELVSVIPFANHSADTHYLFHGISMSLHVAEYICFGVGLSKAIKEWPTFTKNIRTSIKERIKKCWICYLIPVLLLGSLGVVIIPVVQIWGDIHHVCRHHDCRRPSATVIWLITMVVVHGVSVALVHFFTCAIRYVMILASIAIHVIWKEDAFEYDTKGKMVITINQIFQSWFFWQWFIYFLSIMTDLAHIIRPDLKDNVDEYTQFQYTYLVSFVLYDLLAFLIPYICGLKMNSHHKRFYNKLEEAQNEIRMKKKFNFAPAFWEITIPLHSPSYIITIVLAIFAVISNSMDVI